MLAVIDQAERLRQMTPQFLNSRMREAGFRSGMTAAEGDEAGKRLVEIAQREYRMREAAAAPAREAGARVRERVGIPLRESGGDPFLRDGWDGEAGYRGREAGVFDLAHEGIPTVDGPRRAPYEEIEREAELDAEWRQLREADTSSEAPIDLAEEGIPMREGLVERTERAMRDRPARVRETAVALARMGEKVAAAEQFVAQSPIPVAINGDLEGAVDAAAGHMAETGAVGSDGLLDLGEEGIPMAVQTRDLPRTPVGQPSRFKVGKPSGEATDAELEAEGVRLKAAA